MAFAKDGMISQEPIEGGVEISEAQYLAALDGILNGKLLTIESGQVVLSDPPPPEGEPMPEPEDPALRPLSREQFASARLTINGLDIEGIERSQGIGMAMMLDETTAWIFFSIPQPDTAYIVTPSDGVTKSTDYMEVAVEGMANLALIVERVQ